MKKINTAGVTLLELMAVISISAIVFTLVFSSWNYLNKHIYHYESKGDLRNETSRIAEEITLKLRRTPGVLYFTPNSLTLLDQNGSDTLEYEFDGERFTRNGTPVYFGVRGGSITSFTLRDLTEDDLEYMLLEVTVSSADAKNNSDTCRVIVNTRKVDAIIHDTPDISVNGA